MALVDKIAALTSIARESTAELIAHLVELERRNLHLACGFDSLFGYCRHVLRFSEHESYQRMQAAHIAARFPVILPLLADGRLHLAGVRLLAPHLEDEDHLALIGGALGKSKRKIEELLARWFPKPDVPTSIRKVPAPRAAAPAVASEAAAAASPAADASASPEVPASPLNGAEVSGESGAAATGGAMGGTTTQTAAPVYAEVGASGQTSQSDAETRSTSHQTAKPAAQIVPLSEASYYVKLTAPEAMIGRLRLAQELLSHAVPDGDIVEILDRALMLIIKEEQRRRHAATDRPRKPAPPADPATRDIPAHVQRDVTERDGGQCAFVGRDGRRCDSRRFLEYHHLKPWAASGPPSAENIALRCRAHNKYEATVYFDPIRSAMAARAEGP